MLKSILFFCLIPVFLSSCATVLNGRTQKISVSSSPSGADVYFDGEKKGQTPLKVKAKRNKDHMLVIKKPGFNNSEILLIHVISAKVAGNLIAGGFIGWGVDALTGAQYKLIPEVVQINLVPLNGTEKVTETISKSATIEQKLEVLKQLLDKKEITEDQYSVLEHSIKENIS
jgi:hypothetical protein